MDDLELAWETYEFHGSKIYDLEQLHLSNLKKLKIFKQKRVAPTESEKEKIVRVTTRCCDDLIVHYKKQINSIKDLIKIYKSNGDELEFAMTDVDFLNELINVTATLMEEMLQYKSEIKKLFD